MCLGQRSGLHWFERPGRSGAVRPESDLNSLSAILDLLQVSNIFVLLQLHLEAAGCEGVLHDRGGSTGHCQGHGGDV